MANLGTPTATAAVISKYGFAFRKKFGQNFLVDTNMLEKIISSAEIEEDDCVLEIGPGIGTMTQYLAERARKVVVVEIDSDLIPILKDTLQDYDNIEIINQDILKVDLNHLVETYNDGKPIKVVANLPYYITTPILAALLEADCFDSVTVMVQKEVAQRIAAAPGSAEYGAFTVLCQYYAEPELLFDVPAHCFLPQPKVTSAVVRLKVRKNRSWGETDREIFFRTVRASFAMRRKKLSNGLAAGFPELGKAGAEAVILRAGFQENVRGETLGIPEFVQIANAIAER